MESMKTTAQKIESFFKEKGWKYDCPRQEEDRILFTTGVNMGNVLGKLRIVIFLREDCYVVNAILNSFVEKERYAQVAEYLHRANYATLNGNFEFDYDDGEIRYKTYTNFDGDAVLSKEVIEESIFVPVFMFDEYGKNLLRLMIGPGDPKQLIEEAERNHEEEMRQNAPAEDTTSLS